MTYTALLNIAPIRISDRVLDVQYSPERVETYLQRERIKIIKAIAVAETSQSMPFDETFVYPDYKKQMELINALKELGFLEDAHACLDIMAASLEEMDKGRLPWLKVHLRLFPEYEAPTAVKLAGRPDIRIDEWSEKNGIVELGWHYEGIDEGSKPCAIASRDLVGFIKENKLNKWVENYPEGEKEYQLSAETYLREYTTEVLKEYLQTGKCFLEL